MKVDHFFTSKKLSKPEVVTSILYATRTQQYISTRSMKSLRNRIESHQTSVAVYKKVILVHQL